MKRLLPIGILILGLAGFGISSWNIAQREQQNYPAKIRIESRPGAAIIVPFRRRLERAQKNISSVIDGAAYTDPNPLPGGLSVIHSDIIFLTSGASGDILIWLPPEALGEFKFSITAWADASIAGANAARLNSDSAAVTLTVAGEPIAASEPDFAGEWSDQGRQWSFAGDGAKRLIITGADGAATMHYNLYPDHNGRWFLAEITEMSPSVYWIEADGDLLKVSWPGIEFAPFAELRRS